MSVYSITILHIFEVHKGRLCAIALILNFNIHISLLTWTYFEVTTIGTK